MRLLKLEPLSLISISFLAAFLPAAAHTVEARQRPQQDYLVYVVSESADKVSLIRFGPTGARVEKELATGVMPLDIDGPHGLVFSPDRQFYYVSLGHGRPNGTVLKYSAKSNEVVGQVKLGSFPATMDITPDGKFLYVVNFNLHGDMVPSTVSIVTTDFMIEVARPVTCTMPHGSRINAQGTRQYSACMMDDILVEIDTSRLRVSRHIVLTRGAERGQQGAPSIQVNHQHPGHKSGGHGMEAPGRGDAGCSPTWAQPSADGSSVFVACNRSDEIVEVESAGWRVIRRLKARPGVYNLAVTKNGKLVTTNKRDQSISVIELREGRELARIPTGRRVVHGVVVSPDDRYAFVSVEGVGSEPGTVEVVDLVALKVVATVDVAPQAAGIDFFKIEPAK